MPRRGDNEDGLVLPPRQGWAGGHTAAAGGERDEEEGREELPLEVVLWGRLGVPHFGSRTRHGFAEDRWTGTAADMFHSGRMQLDGYTNYIHAHAGVYGAFHRHPSIGAECGWFSNWSSEPPAFP